MTLQIIAEKQKKSTPSPIIHKKPKNNTPATPSRPKLIRGTHSFKDTTGRRLFFALLRTARDLKRQRRNPIINRAYMIGVLRTMLDFYEDFCLADSMRGIWKQRQNGNCDNGEGW